MRCRARSEGGDEMAEGGLVRSENVDGIGVITVDNPPVNALSPGVPEGIVENVERGNADPAIKAMVLIGAGRSFIAGADVRTRSLTRAKSRWSRRYTAMRWAAGLRLRSPPTTGSPCRAPRSGFPRS